MIKAIKRSVKAFLKPSLTDLNMEEIRELWPSAVRLSSMHLEGSALVHHREEFLNFVPKNGVCAEVGIFKCSFSKKILDTTSPEKLHLIDISNDSIELASSLFPKEIESKQVELHKGDSSVLISKFPDNYFDWIYIDGDHTYEGCKKDLDAAFPKMKPEGKILLNDYIYFSSSNMEKFGVVEAVNEFCIAHNYKIKYMSLHGRMYNDVFLERI